MEKMETLVRKMRERHSGYRKDRAGSFSASSLITVLIGVLLAVIIGFALFGTLLSSIASVNKTSSYAAGSQIPALVNLAPLLFILGIVIASIAVVFVALRMGLGGKDG